jgi:hypothetical protein
MKPNVAAVLLCLLLLSGVALSKDPNSKGRVKTGGDGKRWERLAEVARAEIKSAAKTYLETRGEVGTAACMRAWGMHARARGAGAARVCVCVPRHARAMQAHAAEIASTACMRHFHCMHAPLPLHHRQQRTNARIPPSACQSIDIPLEVDLLLIGFEGDGGYEYALNTVCVCVCVGWGWGWVGVWGGARGMVRGPLPLH